MHISEICGEWGHLVRPYPGQWIRMFADNPPHWVTPVNAVAPTVGAENRRKGWYESIVAMSRLVERLASESGVTREHDTVIFNFAVVKGLGQTADLTWSQMIAGGSPSIDGLDPVAVETRFSMIQNLNKLLALNDDFFDWEDDSKLSLASQLFNIRHILIRK